MASALSTFSTDTVSQKTWGGGGSTQATHWNVMKCSQAINVCLELKILPSDCLSEDYTWSSISRVCPWFPHNTVVVGRAQLTPSRRPNPHCSLARTKPAPHLAPDHAKEVMAKLHTQAVMRGNHWFFAELQKSAGKQDVLLRRTGRKHDIVLLTESLIPKWTKEMSFCRKVKRDYWKGEKKGSNFPVSSPLSHFHLDIWRYFKILLRQVHCLETKHLITYSRKQGRKRPKFSFLCDVFLSAVFVQVRLTSFFSFQPQMFAAKPQMLSG